MEPETKKENTGTKPAPQAGHISHAQGRSTMGGRRPGGFEGRRNTRKPGGRPERAKPEFDQKILSIRRVTRVVAGGKRFNFSVALVLGNKKGSVGLGTGKGADTSLAIDKATANARKNLMKIPLTNEGTIPHSVNVKCGSARVLMMPAPGKGLIAGSSVRDVLLLAGVKDVMAKLMSGSKNRLNNGRVAIKALEQLVPRKEKEVKQISNSPNS